MMHFYKIPDRADIIVTMRRDEFLQLVAEGTPKLKDKDPDCGCPFLFDDLEHMYVNFSILDEETYYEVLNEARARRDNAEAEGGR